MLPDVTTLDLRGLVKARTFRAGGTVTQIGDVYSGSLDEVFPALRIPPRWRRLPDTSPRRRTLLLDCRPDRAHPEGMGERVMIMCDVRASGITGEVDDSYLVGVELRPNGGVHVFWSDEPDQAMVFDEAAAAAEFCRDSPLEMFVVSFVPVSPPPPVESEAAFLKRLSRIRAEAEARHAKVSPDEADELRAIGPDVIAVGTVN